jgi:hypothetical protein
VYVGCVCVTAEHMHVRVPFGSPEDGKEKTWAIGKRKKAPGEGRLKEGNRTKITTKSNKRGDFFLCCK